VADYKQASVTHTRAEFALAKNSLLQTSCVMDAVAIVNAELPKGRRPLTSLANPGDLSPKVLSILTEKVPPAEVADAIGDMIRAKRVTKNGVEVDGRQREAGVKLWLAYAVGLPVQRVESVNVNLDAESGVGLRERLAKSPALRAALRKELDAADSVEVESVAEKGV
jgi:hypothetical protein